MFSLRNPSTLRLQTFRPDPAAHPGLHPHRPAGRERHQRQPERLKKTQPKPRERAAGIRRVFARSLPL